MKPYALTKALDWAFERSVTTPTPLGRRAMRLGSRHWKLRLEAYVHEIGHAAVIGWRTAPTSLDLVRLTVELTTPQAAYECLGSAIEVALKPLSERTTNAHEIKTIATVLFLNRRYRWGLPEEHSILVGLDSLAFPYKVMKFRELRTRVRAIPLNLKRLYAERAEAMIMDIWQAYHTPSIATSTLVIASSPSVDSPRTRTARSCSWSPSGPTPPRSLVRS